MLRPDGCGRSPQTQESTRTRRPLLPRSPLGPRLHQPQAVRSASFCSESWEWAGSCSFAAPFVIIRVRAGVTRSQRRIENDDTALVAKGLQPILQENIDILLEQY